VHTGRRWYLVAWDTGRSDWRTFRVDRMQERVTTGARFEPRDPPAEDLAAYVAKGAWTSPRCRARIKLLAPAAEAARHLPPHVGMIEAIDQWSCWFNAGAPSFESLATHLVFLGMDFELSEPAELVEQVGRLAERYRRAVSAATL
jgi:predicted DNA-binding transcriptional regulator YafY